VTCDAGQECVEGLCLGPEAQGDARADAIRQLGVEQSALSVVEGAPVDGGASTSGGAPGPLAASFSTFLVSRGSPSTDCSVQADEPWVDEGTSTWNSGDSAVAFFNNFSTGKYTYAAPVQTWQGSQQTPQKAYLTAAGDPGVTHSDLTGMMYISELLNTTGFQCLAIGVADPTHVVVDNWNNAPYSFPLTCLDPSDGAADGTSIHYDDGGPVLWAANGDDNRFYAMSPCTGQPGTSTCPISTYGTLSYPGYGLWSHPTVDASPSTHNGIIAYRAYSGTTHKIVVEFRDPKYGTLLSQNVVDTFTATPNAGCTAGFPYKKCGTLGGCGMGMQCMNCDCATCVYSGDTTGCVRSNQQVHVTTKIINGGTTYAYVAYDYTCPGTSISKARMKVYEITQNIYFNDTFTLKAQYQSSLCSTTDNEFHTTVSASKYNNGVAFVYYHQPASGSSYNACATTVRGMTDQNLALSSMTPTGDLFAATPTVRSNSGGDYTGAIKKGTPNGLVHVVPRSVAASTSCIPCVAGGGTGLTTTSPSMA
jgi:hypothetical protein